MRNQKQLAECQPYRNHLRWPRRVNYLISGSSKIRKSRGQRLEQARKVKQIRPAGPTDTIFPAKRTFIPD
jgi:hypothetical protein